jgi:hypothetical protein
MTAARSPATVCPRAGRGVAQNAQPHRVGSLRDPTAASIGDSTRDHRRAAGQLSRVPAGLARVGVQRFATG